VKSRVLSALFLAPIVLGIVYLGGLYFVCFAVLVMGIMTGEWRQLCNSGKIDGVGYIAVGIVIAAIITSFWLAVPWAATVLMAGVILVCLLSRRHIGISNIWIVAGIVSVGCSGIALVWLREAGQNGFLFVVWLMLTVWMTDICALFTGRYFGGPKLAPSISPNKTWSGLAGGMLGAALWSSIWSSWTDIGSIFVLAIIGGGTAVLAQLGDLGVSVVKRRFGAKDTGNLIPGHGGLLDRMDGFLGAAPIVALSLAISKGDTYLWS
jgi:phosphatidate cytidylyltransferase